MNERRLGFELTDTFISTRVQSQAMDKIELLSIGLIARNKWCNVMYIQYLPSVHM